jgi:hypothetical protein
MPRNTPQCPSIGLNGVPASRDETQRNEGKLLVIDGLGGAILPSVGWFAVVFSLSWRIGS